MTNPETLVQALRMDMLHQLIVKLATVQLFSLHKCCYSIDFPNIGGPLGSWSRLTDIFQVRRNQTGETEEGEP